VPLDENEVNGIAKSIANWTICNMSEFEFREYVKKTHTSKIQALRGKIGGCKAKVEGVGKILVAPHQNELQSHGFYLVLVVRLITGKNQINLRLI
jgi:hypothetical protein